MLLLFDEKYSVVLFCCIRDNKDDKIMIKKKAYSEITEGVEADLDIADRRASEDDTRLTHEKVFLGLRRRVKGSMN